MKRNLLLCLALFSSALFGAPDTAENIWLKTFYKTDDITRFDEFWKKVLAEKTLEKPNGIAPVVSFSSQVLHRHPELLKGRLNDLRGETDAPLKEVVRILWLSDTPEAREVLKKNGYAEFLAKPVPLIGSTQIKSAQDLDFCWGWFFATGDTTALDPIISALEFGEFAGAAKKYAKSKKTNADRDAAYKDAMFDAAMWSLRVNAKEDAKITEHLEKVFADPLTPKSRGLWLAIILSQLKPDEYKVNLDKGAKGESSSATIMVSKGRAAELRPEQTAELASIDAAISRVSTHAKNYPPKFASDSERKHIEAELTAVLTSLDAALKEHPDNPGLLFRSGFANAMGHNLDFRGCPEQCMKSYEKLLELEPENPNANFYYGQFLASTAAHQKESIQYLEKALAVGMTDSHYTLGLVLLTQGNKKAALKHLHEYARLNPTDEQAKNIIEHINKSEVKFFRTGDKAPDPATEAENPKSAPK